MEVDGANQLVRQAEAVYLFYGRTIDSPPTSAGVKFIPIGWGYHNRIFNST